MAILSPPPEDDPETEDLTEDYAPFERLNRVLARPFDEQPDNADLARPPTADEVVEATFCGT
jgi:uncharacterized protein YdiU (UPF0061 family)